MSAPWTAFWSIFVAKMGSRCGPKWAVNVTKNLGQKLMEKWSQNDVTLGAQRGPKWAPKVDHFFGVFSEASVNVGGGCECRAGGVLSPADPLGRALKSKDTIVQYDTKTDDTEVNII